MSKKLLAVAIAAALAPAAAMAELKISASVQTEVVSVSGDGAALDGVYLADGGEGQRADAGGASWFTFSGSHDLGNGMTGIMKANFDFNSDQNRTTANSPYGRDVFAGLKGGFGTVLFGTVSSAYKGSTVKWDPFFLTFMQARGSGGMSKLHNGYAENVIAYANSFGGAKVVAAVALDESVDPNDPTKMQGKHAFTASANIPVGPVEIALAYIDLDGGVTDNTGAKLGVKYSGGDLTAAFQVEAIGAGAAGQASTLDGPAIPAGTDGATVAFATVSYKAGSNTFGLNVGSATSDGNDDSGDSTYTALGMVHSFNKNVRGHLGVRVHSGTSVNGVDANDTTVAGLGLRVGF